MCGRGAIFQLKIAVAEPLCPSHTDACTVVVPAPSGVPEMTPVAGLTDSPTEGPGHSVREREAAAVRRLEGELRARTDLATLSRRRRDRHVWRGRRGSGRRGGGRRRRGCCRRGSGRRRRAAVRDGPVEHCIADRPGGVRRCHGDRANVPTVVGVPEMMPVAGSIESPSGKLAGGVGERAVRGGSPVLAELWPVTATLVTGVPTRVVCEPGESTVTSSPHSAGASAPRSASRALLSCRSPVARCIR